LDPFWSSLPYHLVGFWRQRPRRSRLPLGEYLQIMHQFDGPIRQHLPRLRRVATAQFRRRVLSWRGRLGMRRLRAAALIDLPADTPERWRLARFHELEVCGRLPFRWSSPDSFVLLPPLAPGRYRLTVAMARARDWHSDLRGHLTFAFNGHPVPPSSVVFANDALEFPITPAMFAVGDRQRLRLRCRPLATTNGDQRLLGVPVVAFRVDPGTAA
jgi:hypothetical protein